MSEINRRRSDRANDRLPSGWWILPGLVLATSLVVVCL
jgi:hypothetical protein